MANQTLRTDVVVDTSKAQTELKNLGKSADAAGVDVEQLATQIRQAGKTADAGATDIDRSGNRIKDTFEGTKDSGLGAASAIGEAFGESGSAAGAVGSMGEVVESLAEGFGPLGGAVALAGGAIIGWFAKGQAQIEATKAKITEVYDALIEGNGVLDQEYRKDAIKKFVDDHADLVKQVRALIGPQGLKQLGDAIGGNDRAYQDLNATIRQRNTALIEEAAAIRATAVEGRILTTAQAERLAQIDHETSALNELTGELDENSGAIGQARQQTGLYNEMLSATAANQDYLAAKTKYATGVYAEQQRILARATIGVNTGQSSDPNRAAGGPVTAGRAYTVGEYGRETFVPAVNGTIVPQGSGAGGTVTINQYVTTNDPVRVAQRTSEALRRQAWRVGA